MKKHPADAQRPRLRDCRAKARQALHRHTGGVILATVLAALFGAFSGGIYGFESIVTANIDRDLAAVHAAVENAYAWLGDQLSRIAPALTLPALPPVAGEQLTALAEWLLVAGLCTAALSLFHFLCGETVRVGLNRYHLALLDGESPRVGVVFSGFGQCFGRALLLRFLRAIRVLLWSLLLIVPGIVASYRYAMAGYVLAENPEISSAEALRESARMMRGSKGRLFALRLSLIGWWLLAILLAGGIGAGVRFVFHLPVGACVGCGAVLLVISSLWLIPYRMQAQTVLYHEISGRSAIREAVEGMSELMAQL